MLDASKLEASKFENVLKSLRVRRGKEWTQKKTAEYLSEDLPEDQKTSLRTYVGWENGDGAPSPEHLKRIATKFMLNQEEEEIFYHAAMQVPPKIKHLPFPPNPFFTGRKTYLEQLHQFLQSDGTIALTQPVSISGLGGIGKTQLALAYAYLSHPKVYRVVLWVNAADRATLQADYDTLSQKLGLPERNEREPGRCVEAVKQWLDDHTHWLLIMDNADDLELARSFFPESNHGHILLTTRSQFGGKIGARQIEIDKMEPEEGLVFLLRRTDKLKVNDNLDTFAPDIRESALPLVQLLDGLPLALDQAGAFIEETGASFTEYINLYQKQRRDLLNRYGALDREHTEYSQHPETVVVTFELCFTKARERQPLAAEILNFCAFLQPDTMLEELFHHDNSFKLDELAFRRGIAALQRYSLIKRNVQEKKLSMHRLVQAVLIDTISPDLHKQWRARVARAVNAAFPEVDFKNWWQCERLLPYTLICATWTEDELTPTVEVTELFHKLDTYLREQMGNLEADTFKARVLSIYEHYLGAEHPLTASALNDLAILYYHQGEDEAAESLIVRALSIQEKHLGTAHPDTLRSLHNLAVKYLFRDRDDEAESLIVRMLSMLDKHLGTEHSDTLRSLPWLASLSDDQYLYEQGELLDIHSFERSEKHLEAEHLDTVRLNLGLVVLLHEHGKHEQAGALYQRVLSIQERRLGAMHPFIQSIKKGYAHFLHSIGRDTGVAAQATNDEPSV